jgi:WD40 repeat protein
MDYKPSALNRPKSGVALPQSWPAAPTEALAHAHPVTAIAASPWAPLLAVAGHERITLYDLEKHVACGVLPFPEGIPNVLRFSRDGSLLLAGGGRGVQSGKVVLFDVRSGQRRAVLGQELDVVLAADVSADGKLVALGGPGKIVKVYTAADGKLAYQITKHTDWITALEFSPDGARLATADRAGGIHLWESATGGIVVSLSEHKDSVTSLSWRGDGQLLASGSEDGQLIVWDASEGWPVATVAKAHEAKPTTQTYGKVLGGVLSVQFMPDGRLVSVGRDRMVRVWSGDGKPRAASTAATAMLTKITASYDSKLALAGDYEGHIQVWDGKKLSIWTPENVASTSPAEHSSNPAR